MHASAFRKIAVRCRSAALGLVLAALARSPAAQTWVEDVVTGSCESLVTYQSGTGVALDGQHYPGKWGITEPTLLIGSKALTDPDVMDEVSISLTNPRPASGRGRPGWVCVQTVGLSIQFRAESKIGAIEWQHGKRPDSACAKEWKRMRAVIRAHEPKHVQDIDAAVAASNKRMAKLRPIEGCGPSALAAQQAAAQSILQLIQAERLKIIDDLAKRAQRRDVEQAQIDCSKCSEGASFKDVTIDCVWAAAPCQLRTGQRLAGRTCGDATSANWVISPHYFTEGCGLPPGDTKGDKDFDSDCVAAGSDEERRRADIYRQAQKNGGGGWMCVYDAKAAPTITIRNFRASICKGPSEQTVTVEALPAQDCDGKPPKPPPPARPNS